MVFWIISAFLATALVPEPALALTLVQVAELFNIFVGLMLTAALLIFFGGLWGYFARLGTWPSDRDQALKVMEWGVAVLFVLVVILAIVQFFQRYPMLTSMIVGSIALLLILGVILYLAVNTGKSTKKEE